MCIRDSRFTVCHIFFRFGNNGSLIDFTEFKAVGNALDFRSVLRTGDNICRFQGELHLDSITYSAPNYPDTARWSSIYGGWRLIGSYTCLLYTSRCV